MDVSVSGTTPPDAAHPSESGYYPMGNRDDSVLRALASGVLIGGAAATAFTYLAHPRTRDRRFLAHLRSRVAEIERARVACELHDGAIQSLIGLEMEVAAWLLGQHVLPSPVVARARDFQRRLRKEIINLRALTQRLRPVRIDRSKILAHLSDLVSNFQRETAISGSFVSKVPEVDLSRSDCYEAARIVQEALTNVRKHSGATRVEVTFDAGRTFWSLSVEDNGVGFDFTGRRSHVELDSSNKGPAVIKERVKLLGGGLTIDSDPARGARLFITVPRVGRNR